MRRVGFALAAAVVLTALAGLAQQAPGAGPYKVLKTAKVGGLGGFDYIHADVVGRRVYIPRRAVPNATPPIPARVTVFDLDTLAPLGDIPDINANGAVIDARSGHGFASSRPVAMWDSKTLKPIKTIEVRGQGDGIMFDPFNERIWVFNPATMEVFSSHGNGTMTIVKENSPTSFQVEQNLQTMAGAKCLTLDTKTNHILTMAAEYGPPPTAANPPAGAPPGGGRGPGRGPMLPDSFTILVIGR